MLHPWQARIVKWAVRVGRAAMWEDTGLGKTIQQIEWCRLSADTSLIVAPLAVCQQTVREAAKVDVTARYVRSGDDVTGPGVWVTNYEMIDHFSPALFGAVCLDEASILKQSDGKTRTKLITHFRDVPYRLACTATPAPNDPEELTSQAEFLGVMPRVEMLASYFVHDSDGWRLKGHAKGPMFRWMSTWAIALRRPSDVGYPDTGYNLPGLNIVPELIPVEVEAEGQLFATDLGGVGGRAKVRRSTLSARVDRAVQLVSDCGSQRVQQGLLFGQQGKMGANSGTERAEECFAARTLRAGREAPGGDQAPSIRVSQTSTPTAEGVAVRIEPGRDRDDARSRMSGMWGESSCGSDGSAAHRPQPYDRHGPRCSLSAMQPGDGSPAGRSAPDDGIVPVHHACRDQWVIWCGLNDEQDALVSALGDECRGIDGRTPVGRRVEIDQEWRAGKFRILVVKPGMYSFGMNWQHCARMAFVGLSDSYESYYQAIRRCYRYGQARIVNVHVVLSELESQIAANVARKESDAAQMIEALVTAMQSRNTLIGESQ
jgi:hypothetical protein